MGILSNFIGSAASAGGEIMQKQREADVAVQSQKTMAEYNNELALKREETIRQAREEADIRSEGRADARIVATETRGMKNRATERKNITDETVANAPKLQGVEAAGIKSRKMAELDPEIQALQRKAETEKLTAGEQAKLDFYKQNEGAIRKQTRDEARDKHIDTGAGLRALQMEGERVKIDMLKADAKLPPAVKGSIASIQKQADAISAAITKAELEGLPNTDAVQKYQSRLSELNGQITKLYEPYLSERDRASLAPKSGAGNMQDVRVGGKVIGQASTAEEAAAMVAKHRQGGTKAAPAPGVKESPAGPPVDRLRDQPIGILTPLATIKEAAAAGNKQAIAYLERRAQGQADTRALPRTAAEMLNQ